MICNIFGLCTALQASTQTDRRSVHQWEADLGDLHSKPSTASYLPFSCTNIAPEFSISSHTKCSM